MFQLRAFQQIRSTIIHPNEVNKSLMAITRQCKEMMHVTLERRNIAWFAEFFTELLMQIGLVPIQETDADILNNVSDKDKLQKLHSRFTSKVGVVSGGTQRNRSSQRLNLDSSDFVNGTTNQSSTERIDAMTPDQYFTGHQEFFFRFIRLVDSYSFSVHLKDRLLSILKTTWSSNDTKGIEQRIMQMQMLAKFLGVLAFSPNWIDETLTIHSQSLVSEITSSAKPFISIERFIQEGCWQGKLTLTIPWILSYIQMIRWDRISIRSSYYLEILSMLRAIHKWTSTKFFNSCSYYASNMLLLSLQLESFFIDVVGLSETECLPYASMTLEFDQGTKLDYIDMEFSSSYVISTSTHLEELQSLVLDLLRVGVHHSNPNGISKKLTPLVLSSYPSGVSLTLMGENPIQVNSQQHTNNWFDNNRQHNNKIVGKMVEAFFHQHKEVQSICNFLIELGIKVASKDIAKNCIEGIVKRSYLRHCSTSGGGVDLQSKLQEPVDIDWYLKVLRNVELDTFDVAMHIFKHNVYGYIKNAMTAIIPTSIDNKVKDIATFLAINHALQKGESIVKASIRSEVKKNIDEHVKKGVTNSLKLTPFMSSKSCIKSRLNDVHSTVLNLNRHLIEWGSNRNQKSATMNVNFVVEVTKQLQHLVNHFAKSAIKAVQLELEEVFRNLLPQLKLLLMQWLPKEPRIKNEIKSEHQLFTVLTVELLSELWNVKVCPQHIQMSMVHLCSFAALRSILLWNDDNYDKVMKVIRKAILCCIIEKQENHQYPHFFIIRTHNIR